MTKQQIEFLNLVVPIAQRQADKHSRQLFASVTIAQAAHESGWGSSTKMVKANALYGVKVGKSAYKFGTAWKGAAYKTGTTEYYDGVNPTKIVDWFRAYDSIEDATEDYMDMLCHCKRYKAALNRATPYDSISAIVAGGYATGPDYASHIMSIIRSCNLTIFDTARPFLWIVGNTYTTRQDLYIRSAPDGDHAKWDDLTDNARLHAFADNEGHPILFRETDVTVKEIKEIGSCSWLRIPSGWICGKNSKNIFVL